MEHLVIYFKHEVQDIIPYSNFIIAVRNQIKKMSLGEYLGDDMAIDGGDAEAIFSCPSAEKLFEFIKNDLVTLSFMRDAKITFLFGALDSNASKYEFYLYTA